MVYKGINLENVKKSNRSAVLQLLNAQGAMSRKDIAEAIGLTPASVTIICTELLEEGIIKELGEAQEEKRAGRKKILVSLNSEYKYVLCVGVEANETYISITNLSGGIVGSKVILTDSSIEPADFFKKVSDEFKMIMWEHQITKDQVLAVGVSVPGKVDTERGISLRSYSVWDQEVPIKDILEAELGLEVVVENNVKAYAKTEILFGNGRSDDHILLLKWGPGVGSAIIINNELYQGATGSAAEIGHVLARRDGKLCKCGKRGCLETEISTHAIIDAVMEAYGTTEESHNQMPVLKEWLEAGHQMRYNNTGEWGALQDEKMQEILHKKVEFLAMTMRNAVGLVDPDKIVVLGYLFDVPGFFEYFKEVYNRYGVSEREDFFAKSELTAKDAHTEALSVVVELLLQ